MTNLEKMRESNELYHEHWQAQPGHLGVECDGRDHGVPIFFPNQVYQKIKAGRYFKWIK